MAVILTHTRQPARLIYRNFLGESKFVIFKVSSTYAQSTMPKMKASTVWEVERDCCNGEISDIVSTIAKFQ